MDQNMLNYHNIKFAKFMIPIEFNRMTSRMFRLVQSNTQTMTADSMECRIKICLASSGGKEAQEKKPEP
jgi:uncharacterized protein (DUF1786 family)